MTCPLEATRADDPLIRAVIIIVRALEAAGFGKGSQITRRDGFEIATGGVIVRVEVNPDA